jgi:apolipoprotein N-acyltransferase
MSLHNSKMKSEYRSYLWLVIGFIFLIFSNGIWNIIPIATWLAPVFLIRFLRTQTKTKGLIIFVPVYLTAWIIMLYGVYPGEVEVSLVTASAYGIIFFLPFLADRLMTLKIKGFLSTLVFPLAWVTIEFILSLTIFYSWFALAYTQHDNLALIQLVSITGIWGISFLITWFASVVNWAWEHEFSLIKIRKGVSLYLSIFIFILLLGGAYLTFLPADSDTVRAAAITRSFDMDIQAKECKGDVPCLQELFNRSLDEFLEDSKQAANAGAKIIVWQENGLAVYQEDEASFIDQGREFAIQEEVYLLMAMYMLSEDRSVDENKAVLIDPSGDTSEYLKNHLVQGDNHILGDGKVLIQDSDYGKLASIICQDTHSQNFVRQAGKANVDVILIPNHNWETITPLVARMASFRAIENGFSMIRADYHGLSTAVDYHGNILSQMNDFTTEERIMIADIPKQGIKTVYSQIGDLFAWLCVFGFLIMVGLSLTRSKG